MYRAVSSRSEMVLRTMKPMLAPRSPSDSLHIFGSGVGTSESGPARRPQIGASAPFETVTAAPRKDAPSPAANGSMLTFSSCCVSWHTPLILSRLISGKRFSVPSQFLDLKLIRHGASIALAALMSTVPRNATPLPACAAIISPPRTTDMSTEEGAEGAAVAEGTTGTTSIVVGSMVPQTSAPDVLC